MPKPIMRALRSLCLAGVALVAVWGLHGQTVFAYHLEGVTWANQPPPGQCCARLGLQYAGIQYPRDYHVYDSGWQAWTNDAGALITYSVVSSSPITLYDTFNTNVAWSGITNYNNWGGTFINAQVYLNYVFINTYPDGEAQGVAAHELGHVAGLAHTNACVMMAPDDYTRWTLCGVSFPQSDDNNGINAMY